MTCSVWDYISRAMVPACLAVILLDLYMFCNGGLDGLACIISIMFAVIGILSAFAAIRRDI